MPVSPRCTLGGGGKPLLNAPSQHGHVRVKAAAKARVTKGLALAPERASGWYCRRLMTQISARGRKYSQLGCRPRECPERQLEVLHPGPQFDLPGPGAA